ncbi:hypothetical protein M440DRAFT_1397743 [Trichoderma longibrachiatum ATCC 18648]|uniref:DUF7924 domain-containing protein n=1 Tax=Trichoderma longibrachiatum ATCC 18648 TaxID=983965 RepID=A0A2T4CFT8_TRILO|nr:hypothetical protein M440DRAFT_1397743 [Trichoderma longibrachiatum ATCC 18648]
MENTPPQEQEHHQEQHLGGQDHPSQPVLPPPAEANSGSERTKKRPRASTSAVCDSADEDHDAKRRQTSDAHDGVAVADTTGNATASTAKNRIATRITFANETAATIAEHINEAAEYASKEGRGAAAEAMQHSTEFQPHILQMENVPDVAAVAAVAAAAAAAAAEDEEERSTIEASGGSTSTSDFVPTEASTLDASSDNSSIHQSSPRSASHGSAALEAENQVNGSYTTHFESFAEWQAFLDGDREKPYPYWASQPNSDCYALTWSTLPKEHKSVVIELFRGAGREAELDRQILGWSIAHDHHRVEISVHYPVIYGDIANFHRKKIRSFDFNDPKCDRWTAYRFTRNLYGTWMLAHFARVCSAIDDLPNKWPRYVDSIDGFQS